MNKQEEQWFEEIRKKAQKFIDGVDEPEYENVLTYLSNGYYSQDAHFLYELIQNADDAGAEDALVILEKSRLIFIHNGKNFTISAPLKKGEKRCNVANFGDINSICAVGATTKDALSHNKIGKFGIGFKSVFKFTDKPIILCKDHVGFTLSNYVVPNLCGEEELGMEWPEEFRNGPATAIILPFKESKNILETYKTIKIALEELTFPLLFLHNLKSISWKTYCDDAEHKNCIETMRELQSLNGDLNGSVYECSYKRDKGKNDFLIFSNRCKNKPDIEIRVCFFRQGERLFFPKNTINGLEYVHCFFPTKVKSPLKFLLHAPFMLNTNREGLREDKEGRAFNCELIKSLAELSVNALLYLVKNIPSLMSEDAFRDGIVPYDDALLAEDDAFFAPFYVACKTQFEKHQMLPSNDGRFIKGSQSCWGPSDMETLFTNEQLSLLNEYKGRLWIFPSIDSRNKQSLVRFVRNALQGKVVSKEDLLKNIGKQLKNDVSFVKSQSFDWLNRFYIYISNSTYIDATTPIFVGEDGNPSALRKKGENTNDQILFHRPSNFIGELHGTFNFINQELYDLPGTQQLFKQWDARHLDAFDVCSNMLAALHWGHKDDISRSEYIQKIIPILADYFNTASETNKKRMLNRLKEEKFHILCIGANPANHCRVDINKHIYLPNTESKKYLDLIDDAYYVDSERYDSIINFKEIFNFPEYPVLIHDCNVNDCVVGLDMKGTTLSCKKYYTHGIISAIDKLNGDSDYSSKKEISKHIWNAVKKSIEGNPNSAYYVIRKFLYYNYERTTKAIISKNVKWLTERWILTSNGDFSAPLELSPSQINFAFYGTTFNDCKDLLKSLNIFEVDINDLDPRLQQQIVRGQQLGLEGLSDTDFEKLLQFAQRKFGSNHKTYNHPRVDHNGSGNDNKRPWEKSTPAPMDSTPVQDGGLVYPDDEDSETQAELIRCEEEFRNKIRDIENKHEARKLVAHFSKYSFGWFKAMFELESKLKPGLHEQKSFSIVFNAIEREQDALVLSHPNLDQLPPNLEQLETLSLSLTLKEGETSLVVGAFQSESGYRLRVKPKAIGDLEQICIDDVVSAKLDVQDVSFLFNNLKTAFEGLNFADDVIITSCLPDKEHLEFIYGPPGTGKTTLLAKRLAEAMMEGNKRILVLTPTNKAADVLVQRITKIATEADYIHWLVRFGTSMNAQDSVFYDKTRGDDFAKLKRCVLVTTLARLPYDGFLGCAGLRDMSWDEVYFDEASMMHLPSILYPILKFGTVIKYTVAGDPKQIGPIAQADEWKDENIYTMTGMVDFKDYDDLHVTRLMEQHRSIPEIGNLYSKFAYKRLLKNDDDIPILSPDSSLVAALPNPISIIDFRVDKRDSLYKARKASGSPYHVYSAIFAYEYAYSIANQLRQPGASYEIGIISPYRIQAKLVDDLLLHGKDLPAGITIKADTIHGFQGDECDVVIALLNPPLSYKDGQYADLVLINRENILNVAISRAKHRLIIICPNDVGYNGALPRVSALLKIARNEEGAVLTACNDVEAHLFGDPQYIEKNTFCSGHQNVNVYSDEAHLYEVRCDENAVDIQLS